MNQTYSMVSSMITTCPPNNTGLLPSLKAFPTLKLPSNTTAGSTITLDFIPPAPILDHYYAAFVTGMDSTFVPFAVSDKSVKVPEGLRGVAFVLVTAENMRVDDATTIAGPAYLYLPYDAGGNSVSLPVS